MMEENLNYQKLTRTDISQLSQIDRTETIHAIYYLRSGNLVLEKEFHQVPDWSPENKQHRITSLLSVYDQGATFFGAFEGDILAGMSVLDHSFVSSGDQRLNLEGLWVSHPFRGKGVGKALFQLAAQEALNKGAKAMYVSATPSENTVHFYQRLGCKPATPIDSILFKKEPEDIHLELIFRGS